MRALVSSHSQSCEDCCKLQAAAPPVLPSVPGAAALRLPPPSTLHQLRGCCLIALSPFATRGSEDLVPDLHTRADALFRFRPMTGSNLEGRWKLIVPQGRRHTWLLLPYQGWIDVPGERLGEWAAPGRTEGMGEGRGGVRLQSAAERESPLMQFHFPWQTTQTGSTS